LLRELVLTCGRHGVPLGLCGEMAASPVDAMALIGLGFRQLSMNPSAIGPVKMMVRSLRLKPLEEFLLPLLHVPDHSLRSKLAAFARDHAVVV
jgi:phosphotransferase system enzyme I (PtsP)